MKRSFTKKLLDKIGIVLLGALVAPIITVLSSNTNEKIMKRSFTKKLLDKIGIVLQKHQNEICESD